MPAYKQLVSEFFDGRIARGEYDAGSFHSTLAERLVRAASPRAGETVLDVATGTGLVALRAARLVGSGGRVVGVDLSPGMLGRARRAVVEEGLGNVELLLCDAESVSFPASTFDLVVCSSALPYMTDIPTLLRRWHQFLRSGGRVAFNCWSGGSFATGALLKEVAARHGVRLPMGEATATPERCRDLLATAGFVAVNVASTKSGRFLNLTEVEAGWVGAFSNPINLPLIDAPEAVREDIHREYLLEARHRTAGNGLWDEMTAYDVTGVSP